MTVLSPFPVRSLCVLRASTQCDWLFRCDYN